MNRSKVFQAKFGRRDGNEQAIVDGLRERELLVCQIDTLTPGHPDLMVYHNGVGYPVEVKMYGKPLRQSQLAFASQYSYFLVIDRETPPAIDFLAHHIKEDWYEHERSFGRIRYIGDGTEAEPYKVVDYRVYGDGGHYTFHPEVWESPSEREWHHRGALIEDPFGDARAARRRMTGIDYGWKNPYRKAPPVKVNGIIKRSGKGRHEVAEKVER